jgi:hypothetical protein
LIQDAWHEPGVSKVSVLLEYRGWNKALLVAEDVEEKGSKCVMGRRLRLSAGGASSNSQRNNILEKARIVVSRQHTIQPRRHRGAWQHPATRSSAHGGPDASACKL